MAADESVVDELPPAESLPQGEQPGRAGGQGASDDESFSPPGKPWPGRGYHFGIGAGQPQSIGGEYNFYEKLFNTPSWYPELWGEYYFLNYGLDLGLRMKLGYYSDQGYAATGLADEQLPLERDLADAEVARDQDSELTLIPAQLALVLSGSPFRQRWVVFQAWFGYQWLYVQNTMQAEDVASAGGEEVTPATNVGWNDEQVIGAAISFDLSWADQRSAYSMRVYGVSGIYLTPFVEITTTSKNRQGLYDRDVIGLMFTFETTR